MNLKLAIGSSIGAFVVGAGLAITLLALGQPLPALAIGVVALAGLATIPIARSLARSAPASSKPPDEDAPAP